MGEPETPEASMSEPKPGLNHQYEERVDLAGCSYYQGGNPEDFESYCGEPEYAHRPSPPVEDEGERERRRIVEWLKAEAEKADRVSTMQIVLNGAAVMIERGEHLAPLPAPPEVSK